MSVAVGIYRHMLDIVDNGNPSPRFNSPTRCFNTNVEPGIDSNIHTFLVFYGLSLSYFATIFIYYLLLGMKNNLI